MEGFFYTGVTQLFWKPQNAISIFFNGEKKEEKKEIDILVKYSWETLYNLILPQKLLGINTGILKDLKKLNPYKTYILLTLPTKVI